MNTKKKFVFPVKNIYDARDVLVTNFDIRDNKYKDDFDNLYVKLDSIRETKEGNYKDNIKNLLQINANNKLINQTEDYVKILFSGYLGDGKSVELWNLQKELNNKDAYFCIYIDLEKETEICKMKFKDFFIHLLFKTTKEIEKINIKTDSLDKIINDWEEVKEIKEELIKQSETKVETKIGGGFNFLNFFKTGLEIKDVLGNDNTFTETIRKTIKKDAKEFVMKFNNALDEIRTEVIKQNHGKDILFIVDGSEKIEMEVYEQLFVGADRSTIISLNANMINGIPIDAFYQPKHNTTAQIFNDVLIPVIKLDDEKIKILRKIVTNRIDEDTFFESPEVLDYCVEMSGGVIRNLTTLTYKMIIRANGKKINMEDAKIIVEVTGQKMMDRLTSDDVERLNEIKNGDNLQAGNEIDRKLMLELYILKHNGNNSINPLVVPYLEPKK